MSNLDISFRALRVLDTSRRLFNLYGFHHVGVNRIIESARIPIVGLILSVLITNLKR